MMAFATYRYPDDIISLSDGVSFASRRSLVMCRGSLAGESAASTGHLPCYGTCSSCCKAVERIPEIMLATLHASET